MEIIVQLRNDAAALASRRGASLRQLAASHSDLRALTDTLDRLDVDLLPLHAGTEDNELQTYFTVPCASRDIDACERIAAAIRQEAVVTAAYLKPDAGPATP
jgi:hypothetical protein